MVDAARDVDALAQPVQKGVEFRELFVDGCTNAFEVWVATTVESDKSAATVNHLKTKTKEVNSTA